MTLCARIIALRDLIRAHVELHKAALGYARAYGEVKSGPWLKSLRHQNYLITRAKRQLNPRKA